MFTLMEGKLHRFVLPLVTLVDFFSHAEVQSSILKISYHVTAYVQYSHSYDCSGLHYLNREAW